MKECGINKDDDYVPEPREERDARLIKEGYKLKRTTCECGREMEIWHKGKSHGHQQEEGERG